MAKKQKSKQADLDFEINFFEGLLNKLPGFIPAMSALADAYTKRGDYQKGLSLDKRLSCLLQDDPLVHYNLACSYSLLGLINEGYAALEKAVLLGYRDFDYMLSDPDLKNLRADGRFDSFFGRIKEAANSCSQARTQKDITG